MFFKKKSPKFDIEKTMTYKKHIEIFKLYDQLEDAVELVETRRLAINIYPKGPDKRIAIKDFKIAQTALIEAVNCYNAGVCEWEKYKNIESDKLPDDWLQYYQDTSHQIIERTIRNFYKRE